MAVRVYDPAKPREVVPNGKLFMYKDNESKIPNYPKNVGGLLTQIRKRWEGRELEEAMFIIDLWGGTIVDDREGYFFNIGRYNVDINYDNIKQQLPERQLFYRNNNFRGLCSVNDCSDFTIGQNGYFSEHNSFLRKHRYCNSSINDAIFYHYKFFKLPYNDPMVEYGNIQYMNPWGMWEFYPAFVIGKQWRRRKTDRPLELLERVTSESDELVLTVGIPTIALSRNPNNPRDARYVAEMLRSYVVYWAFNNNANQWVRVVILNKEAKVDFHKAYFTIQLVLIRDFIYEDNRVIYNQENGTA